MIFIFFIFSIEHRFLFVNIIIPQQVFTAYVKCATFYLANMSSFES